MDRRFFVADSGFLQILFIQLNRAPVIGVVAVKHDFKELEKHLIPQILFALSVVRPFDPNRLAVFMNAEAAAQQIGSTRRLSSSIFPS